MNNQLGILHAISTHLISNGGRYGGSYVVYLKALHVYVKFGAFVKMELG